MPESNLKQLIIPAEYYGQRIDIVLAQLLPDYSRSQLSTWLKEGRIQLNQAPCKPKQQVLGGEEVELNLPANEPCSSNQHYLPEDIALNLIYEDEAILVVNKPAGLVVHPGAGNYEHTLLNALLHHVPNAVSLPRAGIIHRLDKDTTGLLIVAKTLAAHTHLIQQMQARSIQRHYITLVQGHVIAGGEIVTAYGRHPRNRLKMAVCAQGKEAITHYTICKHYPDLTLLNVQLLTGRTHQIRVHMAYIKHPVIGDQLYGNKIRFPTNASTELKQQLATFPRQALHAYHLSFLHPITEKKLTFTIDLPDDFKLLIQHLDDEFALP